MKMLIRSFLVAALVAFTWQAARAAVLTEAKITHIVNDVRTVGAGRAPRPASLNELVDGSKAVRTGIESRTELLFNDRTITRLGANSHFTFSEATRELSLTKGVILLQVPKGAGGARIQTPAVTAGITGTTILLEAGPRFTKLIVIEGRCFIFTKAGQVSRKRVVSAGQEVVVPNNAGEVPAPVDVDLNALVKTSRLIRGIWGAPLEQRRIAAAIAAQLGRHFGETNIALNGPGMRPAHLAEVPGRGIMPVPVPSVPPPLPAASVAQPAVPTTPTTPTPPPNRLVPGPGL